jgi:hypothetical protein
MLGTTAALGRGMKTVAVLAKNAVVDFLCGGPYKLDHNDEGGQLMPVNIPSGINPHHLSEIRRLMTRIRDDMVDVVGLAKDRAMHVNLRLNETNITEPSPVFIDWCGNDAAIAILTKDHELDPGLFRFGDKIPARLYEDALRGTVRSIQSRSLTHDSLALRDWTQARQLEEKRPDSKMLAQKVGVKYQFVIGIVAQDQTSRKLHCAGTLGVGLPEKPNDIDAVRRKMMSLAAWPLATSTHERDLVTYIEQNFALGGPVI